MMTEPKNNGNTYNCTNSDESREFSKTFLVFLKKTYKEKKYYWMRNVFFTVFPVLIILILFQLDAVSHLEDGGIQKNVAKSLTFRTISQDEFEENIPADVKIYFAPDSTFTADLMENLRQHLQIIDENVIGLPSENDIWKEVESQHRFFAVIFDLSRNQTSVPENLRYKIRTKSNRFYTDKQYSRDLSSIAHKTTNEYIDNGFSTLQYAIDIHYMEMLGQKRDNLYIEIERYPSASTDPPKSRISEFGTQIAIFSAIFMIYQILIRLVEEKAIGFREQLRNVTKYSQLNNLVLFLVNSVQLFSIFLICFIITVFYSVWENVSIIYPILLLLLFVISLIGYTFMISSFFESLVFSAIGGIFWYFVPFISYQLASNQWKKFLIIFPLNAFYQGIEIMHDFVNSGHTFSWKNLNQLTHPNSGTFSLSYIYAVLFLSLPVFIFLYFYISNVWPGKYGIPQKFYFLFKKSYYSPNRIDCQNGTENLNVTEPGFENFPCLKPVVKMRHLVKRYGNKEVVKNLSMDIYTNQITVLLGHNGAGKTTTLCMLAGLIPKTSGHIDVDGMENVNFYRSLIGYCPQHNIFLPYLTCREHLEFFGQLRGLSYDKMGKDIQNILEKVRLIDKADCAAKQLSGGMMRKLCLANSIIGNTKLLVLDEPSSGLDPESRRDIWDVLLTLKKNHTILITTHFMEEADVLGDKIAIMEDGSLAAFGSPIFLKQHFGDGYTLKILKNTDGHVIFNEEFIYNTLRKHKIKLQRKPSVHPVFSVTLPYQDQKKYGDLLNDLENQKEQVGIESLSVTDATLEEVFLNSGQKKYVEPDETDGYDRITIPDETPRIRSKSEKFWQIFHAIVYKKLIYLKRKWMFFLMMVLIPILMTIGCHFINDRLTDIEHNTINLSTDDIADPLLIVNFDNFRNEKLMEIVKNVAESKGMKVEINQDANLENLILELAQENELRYYDHLVGALNFEYNLVDDIYKVKIMYSQNLLHSPGILMNLLSNVMLEFFLNTEHRVETINSPMNRIDTNANHLQRSFIEFVPAALMLYMILYLPLAFREKSNGFKKLQNIPPALYWGGMLAFDLVLHIFICMLVIVTTVFFDQALFFSSDEITKIFEVFVTYGFAYLVLIYIVSQCFSSLSGVLTFLSYLQMMAVFAILMLSGNKENMKSYSGAISILHILPDFGLKHSLKVIYEEQRFERIQAMIGNAKDTDDYWKIRAEYDGIFDISQFYAFSIIFFLVAFLFLIYFIENPRLMERWGYLCNKLQLCNFRKKKFLKRNNEIPLSSLSDEEDLDVAKEKETVDMIVGNKKMSDHAMVISKLTKEYDAGNLKAVNDVSFTIKRGECFGLLGTNGAGKSTSFEMMTGNLHKTSGKCFLNGHDSDESLYDYKDQYGYCPQNDALNDFMTAYEILRYTLMVRGCPMKEINEKVNFWLKKMDIEKYQDVEISNYSGGTKRKLNTAMSMIGDPHVIFLDEPTTGVDPLSRRYVWECIKKKQNSGETIVLTSHSMDECEMLCNRLAIMAKGELKCIGYIQNLKSKFGKGFSMIIKTKQSVTPVITMSQPHYDVSDSPANSSVCYHPDIGSVKSYIENKFTCILRDEHDGVLQYFIQAKDIKWASVFEEMDKFMADNSHVVDSYSICESSLEDIFLQFRDQKKEPKCETRR